MDNFFGIVGLITVFVLFAKFLMWFADTDFGFFLIMFVVALYFVWIIWEGFIKK
jgi:hypothetical protein